ncbi:hypothetical protein GH733_001514 [Mirounga leonina]|nr:hypothetical protein GH733_001514 [Mirounga leonina]
MTATACALQVIALLGNSLLICLILMKCSLREPMYLFLCMLAGADIVLSTCTVPQALAIFWFHAGEISLDRCITQFFIIHCTFISESGILLVMAFDHYIAICYPLRYTTILTCALIGKIGSSLHEPMYLFLCMLAGVDIVLSTCIVSQALAIFWFHAGEIPLNCCITQVFFYPSTFISESGILLVMAFDRYIAICYPLRCTTILTRALIGKIGWTEDKRGSISSFIIKTSTEEGPQRSSEGTFREGIDEGAMVSDIVEGDHAGLTVQEDPNLARRHLKVEGGLGAGASLIFLLVPQPNGPEAILGAEQKVPLPLHRVSTNTQVPGLLSCHIYLPVNLSRVKALGTQDHGVTVKSVLIFRHFLLAVSKPHLSLIL